MWTNQQVPSGTTILECQFMVTKNVYTYDVVFSLPCSTCCELYKKWNGSLFPPADYERRI